MPTPARVNLIASLGMADCRACGAPITWTRVKGTDERVPIEEHAAASTGASRYIIVAQTSPPLVEKVRDDYGLDAFPDHRDRCVRRA